MLVEDERQSLLDRFPLSEAELDHLLVICEAYYQRGGDKKRLESLASLFPASASSASSSSNYRKHCELVAALEESMLPELANIFQRELEATFVVGVSETDERYDLARFLEAVSTLTGRRGGVRDDKLWSILVEREDEAANDGHNVVAASDLASCLLRLAIAAYHLEQQGKQGGLMSIQPASSCLRDCWTKSIRSGSASSRNFTPSSTDKCTEMISRLQWTDWVQTTAPEAPRLLALVFQHVLTGTALWRPASSEIPPFRGLTPFDWVRSPSMSSEIWNDTDEFTGPHNCVKSLFWEDSTQAIPLQLALMGLGGNWLQSSHRLYSSEHNGLAFQTFSQALLSFAGPTLILIGTTKGSTLGYYSELAWKSGSRWHSTGNDGDEGSTLSPEGGSPKSFLFRLQPSWNVYQWAGGDDTCTARICADIPWSHNAKKTRYHQYLHSPVSYRKEMLAGLAVGGVADDAPRLHLTPSLENCKAGFMDSTFQPGSLLEEDACMFFDVDALEVWAVRSDHFQENLLAGQLLSSVREATRHHLAQVDRRQFVEDFQSGAYMNHVYGHRRLTRGAGSFTPDEDEAKENYLQSCPTSPVSPGT